MPRDASARRNLNEASYSLDLEPLLQDLDPARSHVQADTLGDQLQITDVGVQARGTPLEEESGRKYGRHVDTLASAPDADDHPSALQNNKMLQTNFQDKTQTP